MSEMKANTAKQKVPSNLSVPAALDVLEGGGEVEPAVDSPIARGDVSPTTGNFTFELLPAQVSKIKKGKRKKGGRRNNTRKGRRDWGRSGASGNRSEQHEDSSTASWGQLSGGVYYPTQYAPALPSTDVVLRQLEFRFSPEMLSSDRYLRQNMDRGGFVPVWVVAQLGEFAQWGPAILDVIRRCLTNSAQLNYDADNDLIRLSSDWAKWLFPADENLTEEEAMWGNQWHIFGDDDEGDEHDAEEVEEAVAGGGTTANGGVPAPEHNALSASASEFVPKAATSVSE